MRRFVFLLPLVFPAVFFSGDARADAVSPPPTTCVDGSMGVSCHGPPRCAPSPCTSDGDCGAGRACRPVPLCIETISCGGITTTMDPNVTGTCLTGHCAIGGTCMTQLVCVPSSAPVDDPPSDGGPMHTSYGCCSTAGTHAGPGALTLLFSLGAWLTLTQVRRLLRVTLK